MALKNDYGFLIMIYEGKLNWTNALSRVLQFKLVDIAFCCEQISDTTACVKRQKLEFEYFYRRFKQKCPTVELTNTGDIRDFTSIKDIKKCFTLF